MVDLRKEDPVMKRMVGLVMVAMLVMGLAGVAMAQGWGPGYGPMRAGGGGGPMTGGGGPMMGPGGGPMAGRMAMMQARMAGGAGCPGLGAANATGDAQAAPDATPVTEEKAKALATEYTAKYFAGYTVERVLPFAGRSHTAYQVELKGPKGETRILHVNPWGMIRAM
jgi:hypothetical protein